MKGTLANVATILVGSCIGMSLRKGISEKYQTTIMQGLALSVGIIGIQMGLKTQNILAVIISISIGAILGELIDIDLQLAKGGDWLSSRVGGDNQSFAHGFVSASLIYCVGAMAVVGSIQEGLTGNPTTLYAKAMLDGISAIVFAASMGLGVAFSAISVLVYQGSITVMSGYFSALFTAPVINEITAVGGILILGISLNMLGLTRIKVANLLPSVVFVVILTSIWP